MDITGRWLRGDLLRRLDIPPDLLRLHLLSVLWLLHRQLVRAFNAFQICQPLGCQSSETGKADFIPAEDETS